jgi:hypothetical protein
MDSPKDIIDFIETVAPRPKYVIIGKIELSGGNRMHHCLPVGKGEDNLDCGQPSGSG